MARHAQPNLVPAWDSSLFRSSRTSRDGCSPGLHCDPFPTKDPLGEKGPYNQHTGVDVIMRRSLLSPRHSLCRRLAPLLDYPSVRTRMRRETLQEIFRHKPEKAAVVNANSIDATAFLVHEKASTYDTIATEADSAFPSDGELRTGSASAVRHYYWSTCSGHFLWKRYGVSDIWVDPFVLFRQIHEREGSRAGAFCSTLSLL
jgi:hypothetical protein